LAQIRTVVFEKNVKTA